MEFLVRMNRKVLGEMDKYSVRFFKNGYYIVNSTNTDITPFIGNIADCYAYIRLKELNILHDD